MTKKVKFKHLKLENFRGIRNLGINLNDDVTEILGGNKTGKSTIASAFTWLLWGKDLHDRKDYEIKTLDNNNNPIHELEHSVTCVIDVQGEEHTLKRVYKEKWVKKRGEETRKLEGHETSFWWNNVPMTTQTEYLSKVVDIFGDEKIFKILTNPLFFNDDTKISRQERRSVLLNLVGKISNSDICGDDDSLKELVNKLGSSKTIDEYRKQVRSEIALCKQNLEKIGIQIEEHDHLRPVEPDYDSTLLELNEVTDRLKLIDDQLQDQSKKSEVYLAKREAELAKLSKLKNRAYAIEQAVMEKVREAENKWKEDEHKLRQEISEKQFKFDELKRNIEDNIKIIDVYSEKADKLRTQFVDISKSLAEINPNDLICPTCKREFENNDKEAIANDLITAFNQNKSEKLEEVQKSGTRCSQVIKDLKEANEKSHEGLKLLQENLDDLNNRLESLEKPKDIPSKDDILNKDFEYKDIVSQIALLDKQDADIPSEQAEDNTQLKADKAELQKLSDELKKKLNIRDEVKRFDDRKKELEFRQSELVRAISLSEREEYTIENYLQAKTAILDQKVNKMFKSVKFKLFEIQLNGGYNEICETLVDGAPWGVVNSAGQIHAGIDIINVLNDHYGVVLPIFFDNAEGCNIFPETRSQIITFSVIPEIPSEESKEEYVKMYSKRGFLLTEKI